MCRFVLYLGPTLSLEALITRPAHSLVNQSYHARERAEPLNGDGFGVAWWAPELSSEPAVFRSTSPAWSNQNLRHLCRVTDSSCVMAHVRAASPGLPVMETNCHPFSHGSLAFMHNGFVAGFRCLRRGLLNTLSDEAFDGIQGSTDSEHLFALFRDQLRTSTAQGSTEALVDALERSLLRVATLNRELGGDQPLTLNLAVSDGTAAVVSHVGQGEPAPSLYMHQGKAYVVDEQGSCHMQEPDEDQGAVLVSSEPLSSDPGWDPVPPDHLVVIRPDRSVELRPCSLN